LYVNTTLSELLDINLVIPKLDRRFMFS
jgi:hypothetical protein